MFYSNDPAADYERYVSAQEKELEKYPICDYCGERITDDYFYEIDEQVYCKECLTVCKRTVEEYVG